MLCLHDTLHDDDPAVQRSPERRRRRPSSLTVLILAAWQVAGCSPSTSSKPCWLNGASTQPTGPAARSVGQACAVKALQSARLPASLGQSSGGDGADGVPMGVRRPRWPPWMRPWATAASAEQWGAPGAGLCLGGLCAVCDCSPLAGLVQ